MSTEAISHDREGRFSRIIQSQATARIVLGVSLALTAAAWYVAREAVHGGAEDRFEFQTQELQDAITDRMIVYEQVLWGGTGLFNASENVSRSEWKSYVASLDISKNWPGIQGLGYAVPLEPEELEAHEASVRAEGFPDFAVSPEGERNEYSSIIYLEPFDRRNQRAFGYDMWSNPMRRAAMTRARDSGLAATSGAITLVQEIDSDVQRGFLTYLPVYESGSLPATVPERREQLTGWVYAAFRMGDLMEEIQTANSPDINFEIFDDDQATEDQLLYDSDGEFLGNAEADDSDFTASATVELQGREWRINFTSGPHFLSDSEARRPTVIAFFALLSITALYLVIRTLGSSHRRERATNRLLQLRSEELEQHAADLEQSNTDLERFAHIASHDLQEPLRTLGSYATLLSNNYKDQLGEEGDRWLGYIEDSSHRMSVLLRDVLNYASVDAVHDPLTDVDLDDVLTEVLEDFAQVIVDEKIVVDRHHRLPVVEGDRSQLGQLLQNLVGNAIKYKSEIRQPRIDISLSETTDEWRIAIRDNGIGIKPEYHDLVFEIFKRVGPRSKHPGTGIGLSICTRVVARHGGTIGLDSEPDVGSEFWFTIPKSTASLDLRSDPSSDTTTTADRKMVTAGRGS